MKILIINKYWYPRGGADVYAIWLAWELKRRGHEVVVFSVKHPKNLHPEGAYRFISSVETERLNPLAAPKTISRMLWSREAADQLAAFIKTERPDVAHLHNIYTQMSPSILPVLKKYGVPTTITIHDYGITSANYSLFDDKGIDRIGSFGTVIRRRGVKRSFIASVIASTVFEFHKRFGVYEKNIDRMIFTTDYVRMLFKVRGWKGDKGTVVPYVVNLGKEGLKPQADDGFIFFAGRLHKTKGVHILIEAARKTGLPIKIAGDGPDRKALQKQAGAMTNIEFLGSIPRKTVLDYMRRARMVVVPSVWLEPFGLVALEPQGLGTPVIASKIGGLSEVLVHGQTGLYVEPEDVQGLAAAMQRLWDDPEEARRMGKLGKRRFKSNYSVDQHMKKIMAVYEELVSK
ncbi:MAG TPA: glycosyltransferase family 4 protein [Patescibacteria group bacterium]|nr:glycosyltransferase family 4 protein [Patescibacteria group bacterium]